MPSGPVPKRSDQRRRVNKPEISVDRAPSAEHVVMPEPSNAWHPMARAWYVSLCKSGQVVYYQPSDWATAYIWAEVLSTQMYADRMSAVMIQAWASAAGELLTTEGARRRGRLELARAAVADPDEDASVTALAVYRDQLA